MNKTKTENIKVELFENRNIGNSKDFEKLTLKQELKSQEVLEPLERLPFQNYNFFKDSVRVLDEFTLKFDNNVFIWQNTNELMNFEHARKTQSIVQVVEYRPGVLAIEKFINNSVQLKELRFYNKERKRINLWDVRKNNPWKQKLGKRFDPNSVFTEYAKSHLEPDVAKKIKPSFDSNYCGYEIYNNSGNVCLFYYLSALDNEKNVLYKSTYIVIIDSLGKEVYRTKEDFKIVNHTLLSFDKKYLFITGGDPLGEGAVYPHNSYLKLLDLKQNMTIYYEERKDINEEYRKFGTYSATPNLIYVSVSTYNPKYAELSMIYDLFKMQRCEKYYSNEDFKRITTEKIPFTPNNRLAKFEYTCSEIMKL